MRALGILLLFISPTVFGQQFTQEHEMTEIINQLEDKRKSGDCISDQDFIDLQNRYDVVYHELKELGYTLCSESEIRYNFFQFLKEYPTSEAFDLKISDTSLLEKDSVQMAVLKNIVNLNEDYPFLIEQDLIEIIGKKSVDKFKKVIIGSRGGGPSGYEINPLPNQLSSGGTQLANLGASKAFNASPVFLVDAAAQFLVQRTRQELNTAFIDKFRTTYRKNWEFKMLFPSTNQVILYNDPLNFTTWSSQLQLSLKKDITKLPASTANFIKKNEQLYDSLDVKEKEILESAVIMLRSADLLNQGYHPVQSIRKLYQNYITTDSADFNVHRAIGLSYAAIQTFAEGNKFIAASELAQLTRDRQKIKLISLLFTSQNKAVLTKIPYNRITLYEQLKNKTDYELMSKLVEVIKGFSEIINQEGRVLEFEKVEHLSENQRKLLSFNAMLPLLSEVSFNLYRTTLPKKDTVLNRSIDRNIAITKHISELNNNIALKNYSGAVFSLSSLSILTLEGLIQRLDAQEQTDKVVEKAEQLKRMIYWGGFIADFVSLKGEYDLEKFLLKYATPKASYRTKKNHTFTVSLNAYPGFFGGNEQRSLKDNFSTFNTSVALSAPIGVSFTQGFKKGGTKEDFDFVKKNSFFKYTGWTHGLFFPIIDIGAPFAYRWESSINNTANGFTEEIKWSQLFSPGVYYQLGMRKSGLTFSIGGQMTPELRAVSDSGIELQERAWRFGVSAIYDIPVFNVWSSKK